MCRGWLHINGLRRGFLCVFAALLIATPAWAASEDQQLWLKGGVSVRLGERTRMDLDAESRLGNDPGGLYEVELNSLVTYEVAQGVTMGGGYVRSINYARGRVTQTENRLRAHLGVSGTTGRVGLSGRVRLEYRERSDGKDAGMRLRPQIRATLPAGTAISLIGSHESFFMLNDTDWGQRAGYQRMRNFAGIVWRTSDHISVETGYMNEYNFGRSRAPDVMRHAFTLAATLRL